MVRVRRFAFYPLLAVLLTAATCPPQQPLVIVHYRQVGACNGYKVQGGPGMPNNTVSAGAGAAYVVFKVLSIDNSKSSNPFNYDPDRMFVNGTSPEEHSDSSRSIKFAKDIGGFTAAEALTVPAGSFQNDNRFAVVLATGGEASDANNTNYVLVYSRGAADPGVSLAKENSNQTAFPNTTDCRAIGFF